VFEKVLPELEVKLALGTVQFGVRYGVANSTGQVNRADVAEILHRATAAGFDTLDTAIAYGESEACLGAIGVANWRVVTKLPALPSDVRDIRRWVATQLSESMHRLGVAQLEALLLHRSSDLFGPSGGDYLSVLQEIKETGLSRSLGVSIYDTNELDAVWSVFRPDIVQAPCNVLDRRLIRSGWLARLRENRVRVHIRSAFLQGLLIMPVERRPVYFAPKVEIIDRWLAWCKAQNVSPLAAALSFVRAQPGIECVVVGVDSLTQLTEIVDASEIRVPLPPDDLYSEDRELIEPSRWKLT
jgi:aryl-alcohol dehydrogenase-like predicted oxidoreductase